MPKQKVIVGDIDLFAPELFLIAGPCVIEDEKTMLETAYQLKKITDDLKIKTIFKSSFIKDNRSSLNNYIGPGLKDGLKLLKKIKQEFNFLLLSDIHEPSQAEPASEVLDILQIPAYLCMQTSLLLAACKTGKCINIKHGQFLSPQNMIYPVNKCLESGNNHLFLTERGYTFGYNDLVFDPRSLYELRKIGFPVVFDVTHTVRKYGIASSKKEGGARQYIPILARSAAAAGVDGFFIETHVNPEKALCDAATQIDVRQLKDLLVSIIAFHNLEVQNRPKNGTLS